MGKADWRHPSQCSARCNNAGDDARVAKVRSIRSIVEGRSGEGITRFDADVTRLSVKPGETIYLEGDPAKYCYKVGAGVLRLTKLLADGRRQVSGFLYGGDFLGVCFGKSYACSAEAVTLAHLCRFARGRLEALFRTSPSLQMAILRLVSNELDAAQEQIMLLGRKTADEKIASFLLSLSRRAKRQGASGNPLFLPMARADIGDYLGMTVETASRVFRKLERNGLIHLPDFHTVVLDDLNSLTTLAEGDKLESDTQAHFAKPKHSLPAKPALPLFV